MGLTARIEAAGGTVLSEWVFYRASSGQAESDGLLEAAGDKFGETGQHHRWYAL